MLITQPVYIFFQNCLAQSCHLFVILNINCKFRLILWELIFFDLPELTFILNGTSKKKQKKYHNKLIIKLIFFFTRTVVYL